MSRKHSFGISGFFQNDIEIFYEVIFSTQSLGRVSDLLLARFKKTYVDELRLRVLLAIGSFPLSVLKEVKSELPLGLECGVDSDKLVLGLSFVLSASVDLKTEGFADRVLNQKDLPPFEAIIYRMAQFSDRMTIRYQPSSRRMELVLTTKANPNPSERVSAENLDVVLFLDEELGESSKPKKYTQLADLDFNNLLGVPRPSSDESLSSETVSGASENFTERHIVSGRGAAPDQVFRIRGEGAQDLLEKITVKGHGKEILNQDRMRVSGEGQDQSEENRVVPKLTSFWQGTKKTMGKFFGFLQPEKMEEEVDFGPVEAPSLLSAHSIPSPIEEKNLLAPNEAENPSISTTPPESTPIVEDPSQAEEAAKIELASKAVSNLDVGEMDETSDGIEKALMDLWTRAVEKSVKRIKDELATYQDEFKSERPIHWIHNIIQDFVTEKSRFVETGRQLKIGLGMRDRKLKARASDLLDSLNQKELERVKLGIELKQARDQLVASQTEVDQLRERILQASDGPMKQKYQTAQKNFVMMRDENIQLMRKLDELKSEANKQADPKGPNVLNSDYSSLREKYVQIFRFSEELKRTNRTLQDQLNDAKRAKRHFAVNLTDDVKARMEQTIKSSVANQREIEELRAKVVLQQKQEANLKGIVSRLQAEVTRLMNKRKPNPDDGV